MLKLLCLVLLLAPLGSGQIAGLHFPRLATPLAQVIFVLAAAGAFAFVWWCYRREADYVTPQRKRLLAGLRSGAVAVILFICTGCFVELTRSQDTKGRLLVLIDNSQSMSIVDRRTTPEELATVRSIAGADADPAKLSRSDLVRAAFANQDLDLITAVDERFAIEAYTFGQGQQLTPLELGPAGERMAKLSPPAEGATQLGAAISDAAKRAKGRTLDGVVVITDGGWNRGEDPIDAAKAIGVPVHTVGVGLPQTRDIEVVFVFAEDVVFKNDRFTLDVRLRSRGYNGRAANLQIHRIDEQGNSELVKEEPVDLGEGGELARAVEVLADREGLFTYVAELIPFGDEANTTNNRRSKSNLRVVDKKIQVLLIDDAPRWEFRFIRGIIEADRQRLAHTMILRQGDEASHGGKFLRHFPGTLAELRKYDAIIIGDMVADFFTGEELRVLEQWVRIEGGGLMLIAGRRAMPGSYAGTALDSVLPVESEPQQTWELQDELTRSITKGFRPVLTDEGKLFAPLRFSPDEAENARFWSMAEPLYWFQPVKRLKSGATAYIVHPDRQLADGSPMPLLAGQRYGKGQVLYAASDESWRWRYKPGALQHRRYWGQLISNLAMAHLLGASSRTQLAVDKSEYGVGERATVIGRVLDQDYNPLVADSVTVTVERELQREQITLTARKDQPGVFAGEWVPVAEGRYRLSLPGTATEDPGDERSVDVVSSRLELDDSGMRTDLLAQMAQATTGTAVTLDRLPTLVEALTAKTKEGAVRREERTLWNAPGVMLLLALLLCCEWFLRKRSDLL